MPSKKYKHDLFFSYCSGNRDVVLRLADELMGRGIEAWAYQRRDYNQITAAINEAIECSRDFVIFCSQHHAGSKMCDLEMQTSVAKLASSAEERRILIINLDQEGQQQSSKGVYMNFRSNRSLIDCPPNLLDSRVVEVADWIESQVTDGRGPDPNTLAVPVAVLAMTKPEVAELEDGSQVTDKKAYEELKAFLAKEHNLTDLSVAYADKRDDWRPFEWPHDPRGWPDDTAKTLVPASETISAKVEAAFAAAKEEEQASWKDSLVCSFCSEQLFSRDIDSQMDAQRALRDGPTGGCIFVVDVISLLHRELLDGLKGALGTLNPQDCAFVLLSPLQLDAQQLHRRLYLGMKRARIDDFMNRYRRDLDPRAEIAGAGLHGMRRWLKRTFPEMFNHWFARGARPDEANLHATRVLPGSRKGPPPGQMQQDAGRRLA